MASINLWSLYFLSCSILCLQMSKQSQLPFLLKTSGYTCQHKHLHHTWQYMGATPGKSNDLIETSRLSWKAFVIHCHSINIVWHRSDRIEKVTVKRVRNLFASRWRSASKTRAEAAIYTPWWKMTELETDPPLELHFELFSNPFALLHRTWQ